MERRHVLDIRRRLRQAGLVTALVPAEPDADGRYASLMIDLLAA